MRALAALAFALALVACRSSEKVECEGRYHFHTSFPSELRADALRGVEIWNASTSSPVTLEGESDDTVCSFRRIDWGGAEYEEIKARDHEGKDFMGFSLGKEGSVIVSEGAWLRKCIADVGSTCMIGTTLHELGHAHGLEHLETPGAMMNPQVVRLDFTPADRDECVRAGACSR